MTSAVERAHASTREVLKVIAVVPALNEEACIADVVRGLADYVHTVIVVDNGSTDGTSTVASAAGAVVVYQSERGYGAACLAGIERANALGAEVVLFADGDGSDASDDVAVVLQRLVDDDADLVLGVRARDRVEPGAMTPVQAFGNWFAPWLLRNLARVPCTDLPPLKAIRSTALATLELRDRRHGFTVEMIVRAHTLQMRVREVPVRCLARKGGTSKVSGTVIGSARAGAKILTTVARQVASVRYRHWTERKAT